MGNAVMHLGWLQPTMDSKPAESYKAKQISCTKTLSRRYVAEAAGAFPYVPSHCNIQLKILVEEYH